ncbi:MAG: inositol monophosphatase family protein [Planctomycetaceae bacterium]
MTAHTSRLEFALSVGEQASELILSHYRSQTLGVESKADDSPVTVADKGAEQLIRGALAERFPDDGVLGEEFDDLESRSGYRWILDPIDGTKPFIYGIPLFGNLIGIEFEGRMVAGVCRFPALGEVMFAEEGQGAWWKIGTAAPVRATVSAQTSLAQSRLMFTEPTHDLRVGRGDVLPDLLKRVRIARGWGDCCGHMLVATGRADLAVDPEMSPWDIAALIPIVRESGGSCTDWQGRENIFGGDGVSVAPGLKDEVLDLLKQAPSLMKKKTPPTA